ncbi:HAD family phosphatase [Streptomyces sp. N2-109]|uniref:HAD family phosphatase n=1 Tax=Streptomyces gossypii TaxID=2883101 RepID=A0ABT2JU51_9ACTN|nr:HAD family phosphatase [Streptomyces gossypii]MCT2591398.1 HAD family phosphatase [Streptomyces gossypii]
MPSSSPASGGPPLPSPSPPVPVIFDLDGTLVDSEPHYYEAGRRVLAEYGVPGFSWREHTEFIGVGTRETLSTLRDRYGIDAPVDELLERKNRVYLELARTATEVFPQMRKLVELLHASGHPMAVASGSSRSAIAAVLGGTGLDTALTRWVSAEEVRHGKPAPDVYLAAAGMLAADPRECVALEDAAPGAEAARRAGMRCVAVPYVPESAGDPAFAGAGLLFPGGQQDFDARRTYDWIRSGSARRDTP